MRIFLKYLLIFLILCLPGILNAQTIQPQLSAIPGISFKKIPNEHFKEYYEIFVQQPVDHDNQLKGKFKQRIFLGFNSTQLPTIINTDGYGIEYASKPSYQNELATLLNANLITIEHRYFGKSLPDSLDYSYLTVKQSAADAHSIKVLFSTLLKNKWISSGISKGGQAALAYKLYHPKDVSATIVYGTSVKKDLYENKIDSMLAVFEKTSCGNKLEQLKLYVFKKKQRFIPRLLNYNVNKRLFMKQFDLETYLDYILLELNFSFLQNGHNCIEIPDISLGDEIIFNFLISVVPPSFYDINSMERLKPAFYMAYHELGYYEYNIEKYRPLLKSNNYSNKNFAPSGMKISFDKTYLTDLNNFLRSKEAKNVIFIYGEKDPWSAMQNTGKARKEIIKNGSHKSRIMNMELIQKENLIKHLKLLLN
jgi:hypothetical protein